MKSQPLNATLETLLESVNQQFGANFNGILVNEYLSGENYISAHSDDESALGNVGVVCISWGSERTFRCRQKIGGEKTDIVTTHGQIMHMGGEFQSEFTHEIPKRMKVKEPRISFTFRHHTK